MNDTAYLAVTGQGNSAGFCLLPTGFLAVTGRDRISYLQGQISNDIAAVPTGGSIEACLLNNTGHLLTLATAYVFDDHVLLATDQERVETLRKTLDRYIVRERVEIELSEHKLLTLQGAGAGAVIAGHLDRLAGSATLVNRPRLTASTGVDLIVAGQYLDAITAQIAMSPGASEIDEATYDVLRVESGEPKWGNELDESIIPLEAGLEHAISYTKGCYMGQEIIARIHSRGHTNRTLVGLTSESAIERGTTISAIDGDRAGQEIGRITSSAFSPRFGFIGLGYVRNEYSDVGILLKSNSGSIKVSGLPYTHGY